MEKESIINSSGAMDTVPATVRTVGFSVAVLSGDAINVRPAVDTVSKPPMYAEEVVEETGLRDKFAAVRRMRTCEAQEALARECDLSRIINELQQRQSDAAASRVRERQTHERHTDNLVRENTALRAHISALEGTFSAKCAEYDARISLYESRLADASNLLVEERAKFKKQQSIQEESLQQLCANLYNTQVKLGLCEEELLEHRETCEALQVMTAKWKAACRECELWADVLKLRESHFLLERDALFEMQCCQSREKMKYYRNMDENYQKLLAKQTCIGVEAMRDTIEESNATKQHFLDTAALALAHQTLVARHTVQAGQLSELSARHESLAHLFAQRTQELSERQQVHVEDAAWKRALEDATIGYVLHQRDEEVRDTLSRWKDWLLEAHDLLRALLKRYEPFQRGDEVFVRHVIDCLSAAPHVKDPVNVILP